jgi:8-oxo-dGTP pyrophosphatase MutT (NUDIX family)
VGEVTEIVLGQRRRERDGVTWSLPKGTPNDQETLEETALREVTEETGLEVRILAPIGPIEYQFVQRGTRIHKTVHYYLMEPTGGDLARHDREFQHVRWVPIAEAETIMSFSTERDIVGRALELVLER